MEIVQMAKDTLRSAKYKAKGIVLGTIYLRPKIFVLTVAAVVLMGYKSVFAADYDLFYTKANMPLRNAFQADSTIEISKVGSGKILDFWMRAYGNYSSVSPFTVYTWNGKAYGWVSGFGNYSEKYVFSTINFSFSPANYGCGTNYSKRIKGTVAVSDTFDFSTKNDLTTSLPSGSWATSFSNVCFGGPASTEASSGPAFLYNGLNGNVTSIAGKDYVVTGNIYANPAFNLAEMPSGLFVKVRTPEAIKTAIVGAAGQGANNTFNLFPTTASAITSPFVGFVNTIIDGGDGKKCFPTVQAYTSTTSWKQISVVCHDFSLTDVGATTYNVGVDNSVTRVSLIKGSTDAVTDAKVAKCASGSVYTAPLSNLSVSTAPASNPAVWTNSGKPCSEVFVDKIGKDGVMESDFEVRDSAGVLIGTFPTLSYIGSTLNGYATTSAGGGTVYTNPHVSIPGFWLSAPPYNSCSTNDVQYVRSFAPMTLTGGVWSEESWFSKLSFSGWITLATNGSTGSTNPNSLSVWIPQNTGWFFEIWGDFDSAYVEFSQTGSVFYSEKPDPLNSPWSLYGYLTPFKRFYTGRSPFEFVNSSNEILSLSKISVGSSTWEKRTTTTCVDSNGVITTTTSTGSYVPPDSGSGVLFGTGWMPSIGPPETGNAVADWIIGVIYEKIGWTLDGIVGPISSMVATPFPDTPDLTLEIPRILLSGGTATAGMSMDVSKQQAEFVVDRMDSITHGWTYKKPFEFVNLEDSGGPRNAISAALAVAYGALVLMAFWILLWPIYLAKSAGNLLSSRFDAPSSGGEITVLGVVARVAYYAALTALVWTLMTVWWAAVFSVFDVIISFAKAILTFLAVMFGSYPVFANIANLVPTVSIGGAVLVLVYRYAMGVRVSL